MFIQSWGAIVPSRTLFSDAHLTGHLGGPEMTDHENRFYGVFWRTRSTSSFLPHQNILIVTKVIKGQRLCVFLLYARFPKAICRQSPFFKLQYLSSPATFELFSPLSEYVLAIKIKKMIETNFVFKPLNTSYLALNILGLFFDDFWGPLN